MQRDTAADATRPGTVSDQQEGLTPDEVEQQEANDLPNREAMSLLGSGLFGGTTGGGAAPDLASGGPLKGPVPFTTPGGPPDASAA